MHEPSLGSPGFKRFRPIVREKNGALRRLTNAEIAKNPQYGDFSLEQSQLGVEDFYDRMDDVMSPEPLDPVRAMTEAITALEEQVKTRVTAVENGRKYPEQRRAARRRMPDGAVDLRDQRPVGGFLDAGARFPPADRDRRGARLSRSRRAAAERYAMPTGKSAADVKAELQGVLASELAARKFSYTRSDGSPWTLRSRTSSTARRISRWPTTPTTASNCAGARRRRATRRRPASATRRPRSAPR